MNGSRRPSRVGLVDCAVGKKAGRATRPLLDDLAEAGAVYERRSGAENPIEFVRGGVAGCEALILVLDGCDASFGDVLDAAEAGAAVYAVCACMDCAAEEALGCLWALEQACEQRGLAWRGGLAVGDAQVVPAFERSPRLGFWRRPVSEGLDELLLCVRCGADAGRRAVRPGPLRRARAAIQPQINAAQ